MSTGVEESLALETAGGGEDLLFICRGGMEDMVVERKTAKGVGTSRSAF